MKPMRKMSIDDEWEALAVLCRLRGELKGAGWSDDTRDMIMELLHKEGFRTTLNSRGKLILVNPDPAAEARVRDIIERLPEC